MKFRLKSISLKTGTIKIVLNILKLALFTAVFIVSGGQNVFSQTFFNNLEQNDSPDRWIGTNIDSAFSRSGRYASVTDSARPYGLGVEMAFPDEVKNKNINLLINGYVLAESISPDAHYVITIENKGETAFWKGVPLSKLITTENRWFGFADTVKVPANLTKSGKLKTYLWNAGRKSNIYIDDLSIAFEPVGNPSYLADVDTMPEQNSRSGRKKLFENGFYTIWTQDNTGFSITDTSGREIVPYVISFFNEKLKGDIRTGTLLFAYAATTQKNGNHILTFKTGDKTKKAVLRLICTNDSPEISVRLQQKFKKETEVFRNALLVKTGVPLKEVYRSNRKSDICEFKTEYWLDKQGFTAGNDTVSVMLYHAPHISSIQFDRLKNLAVVNIDYEKDHPYLRFPLNADTFDLKIDRSTSIYKRGDILTSSFKLTVGIKPVHLPRFMKNPAGYEAAYIWTEHADWGDIRTHRATYFGSEKITDADSAVGGFVKYRIPVTKSVFYDNPDSIRNTTASAGLFTSLESSIKTDTSFRDFLFQIYKKGSEICLHTPEQYTTTPERLQDALEYMKEHFHSPTWIDHGYNNLPENNREDFVCSGVDNFASDLWKKYGIKYFWNPWYEDFEAFKNWGFFGSIENFYRGFGDFMPEPDFWLHPTRTAGFYHWPTYSVLYIETEGLWDYYFSKHQLNLFVSDWGVEINHCYPAWTLPGKGFWKFASDSTIAAMDGFNRTLGRMARLRDKGVLNVTTVEDFINYRLSVENVSYTVLPDGRIKITNNSGRIIKGLSFAVKARFVLVNGLKPFQKQVDDDLVFWFDLPAGKTALIRVTD